MLDARILELSNNPSNGKSVAYIMSRDQRTIDNHALLLAQAEARKRGVPVIVVFCLYASDGVRAYEHYTFMLDGLQQVAKQLDSYNIPFVLVAGEPFKTLTNTINQLGADTVFFDFSPLKGPRQLAKQLARQIPRVFVVDTHNSIPVWVTSQKQEFAAHTIRTKIHGLLESYLIEPDELQKQDSPHMAVRGISFEQAYEHISEIPKRGIQHGFKSGEAAARRQLDIFIHDQLEGYANNRNNPSLDEQSDLSPYLHFGQISSLRVALEVMYAVGERPLLFDQARMAQAGESPSRRDGMNALFEELIVRKELSDNFCLYAKSYSTLEGAPAWAQATLADHETDERPHMYTEHELEQALTHDPAWNAAQQQLLQTGKIHGYMRMYWAKKILEWSPSAAEALSTGIYLNDAYSLDGKDPNGYVGLLWSIAGLHDRPWLERPIYGKIRYMNEAGLRRKFAIDRYITRWIR